MEAPSLEFCIFHPDRSISSEEDAINLIKKADAEHPWEPANKEHLSIFGSTASEELVNFPILALDSVHQNDGDPWIHYLLGDGSLSTRNLRWTQTGWDSGFCYLAVRKKAA